MLNNSIWFVVSLGFLGWVIYLKWQIVELKKDKQQLAAALRFAAKRMPPEIETSSEGSVWGQRPGWMK
jgi:hypothetical protein